MTYILFAALTGLTVLIGLSGRAFAGEFVAVPEPGTLALLAAGFGGVAAVKFFRRR